MLALPLSDEALQFPELECGASSRLLPFRRSLLWAALSRNFTLGCLLSVLGTDTGMLAVLLPLELDELGFLSCDLSLLRLVVTVS